MIRSCGPGGSLREATTYRVYRFAGRDLIAVPAGEPVVRSVGVSFMPAATTRARAFRVALRGLVAARLDAVVAQTSVIPVATMPAFDWAGFVAGIEQLLGYDGLRAVVMQPRQLDRARVYVHLVSRTGERIAFAKVATDAASDLRLGHEETTLRGMMRVGAETFRIPSVLGSGHVEGHHFLLLAPLPARSRPHPPAFSTHLEKIRREIAGPIRILPAITDATWWPEFESRSEAVPALARELAADCAASFASAGAHGDFVNWNVHVAGEDHWLFDWEAFAPDAPLLADEVRFTLGLHTRAVERGDDRTVRALLQTLGCRDRERRLEVARALAFLHARETTTATLLAARWPSSGEP